MKLKPITEKKINEIIEELLEEQDFASTITERAARMMLTRTIRSTVNEVRLMLHIKQHIRNELKGEYASEMELNSEVDKLIDQSLQAKSLSNEENTLYNIEKIAKALQK